MSDLWAVLYEGALARWIDLRHPDRANQLAFEEWVEQCLLFGPPYYQFANPDDERITRISGTTIDVAYYAFDYERLILVKQIFQRVDL